MLFNRWLERVMSIKINRLIKSEKQYSGREYQFENVDFGILPSEKVIDLGSGNHPFQLATHLADLYFKDNFHRGGELLVLDERPIFQVDLANLPFRDKEFDFVYCSHVLEHVDDPKKACSEIIRIGKRGYIETPTRLSDMTYNFSYLHKWHVNLVGNSLVFIEYSDFERHGTQSSYFAKEHHSPYENDIKKLVFNNRRIFCNMFLWCNSFDVFVFNKDGVLV